MKQTHDDTERNRYRFPHRQLFLYTEDLGHPHGPEVNLWLYALIDALEQNDKRFFYEHDGYDPPIGSLSWICEILGLNIKLIIEVSKWKTKKKKWQAARWRMQLIEELRERERVR